MRSRVRASRSRAKRMLIPLRWRLVSASTWSPTLSSAGLDMTRWEEKQKDEDARMAWNQDRYNVTGTSRRVDTA
ncbi:hypothetical protein DFH09DRAFT_1164821 [Mycena vulgaris]|nr:hypothetical protein DFH09DRAFT_1164821 [Mycena vulgaris]